MSELDQRARALAGKLFDAHCPQLMALKHRAHQLCQKFNRLDEKDPRRREIIPQLLGSCGENVGFMGNIFFNYGCNTHIGNHFFGNYNLTVLDDGPIHIGDHVMIGPNVSLIASSHPLLYQEREALTYPDGHVSMSEYAPPSLSVTMSGLPVELSSAVV